MRAEELQDWELLQVSGPDREHGLSLAHRAHREWATYTLTEARLNGLSPISVPVGAPDSTLIVDEHRSDFSVTVAVRTNRSAKTAEVDKVGQQITADVTDGLFLVTVPTSGTQTIPSRSLRLIIRNATNEVVYEGDVR